MELESHWTKSEHGLAQEYYEYGSGSLEFYKSDDSLFQSLDRSFNCRLQRCTLWHTHHRRVGEVALRARRFLRIGWVCRNEILSFQDF